MRKIKLSDLSPEVAERVLAKFMPDCFLVGDRVYELEVLHLPPGTEIPREALRKLLNVLLDAKKKN